MAKEVKIIHIHVRDDEDSGERAKLQTVPHDPQFMHTESHRHNSALKIQNSFRRMRGAILARSEVRDTFNATFGESLNMINVGQIFSSESNFLRQFIFFFRPTVKDEEILFQICKGIADSSKPEGDNLSLTDCVDYSMIYLAKKFALICLQTAHKKRFDWCNQIMLSSESKCMPFVQLLESVACLLNCESPLVCKIVGYLQEQKVYLLFREIVVAAMEKKIDWNPTTESVLEKLLITVASHFGDQLCCCPLVDIEHGFVCNILSVNDIWSYFNSLKKVFWSKGLSKSYIHQMACNLRHITAFLPHMSASYPGYACILINLLEADESVGHLAKLDDMALVYSSLLDVIPNIRYDEDGVRMDDNSLHKSLYRQIAAAFYSDSPLLKNFVNHLMRDIVAIDLSDSPGKIEAVVETMQKMSTFLYILLDSFGPQIASILANHTDFLIVAMKYLNLCKSNSVTMPPLAETLPSWIITLHIFALIYKYILETLGHDEFYENQKPFSINDIQSVVLIMKEALWDLLCRAPREADTVLLGFKKLSLEKLKSQAKQSICNLLIELQDWNTRGEFTSASNFCCEAVNEEFIYKALQPDTVESQILEFAPLLIPFHIRAAIYESRLNSAKTSTTTELEIRRRHLFDDSFKLCHLTVEQLKGKLMVIFVDKYGLREDGVDLGGLFREFIEDTSKAAFGTENKLMQGTADNLLYPNPSSGYHKKNHLKQFQSLGTLLGKAMFDRVTLDLPLAPFFIRKLKEKSVFHNDLISLDVEMYKFFQTIKTMGDLSNLSLFFSVEKNENGKPSSEELIVGGREKAVTYHNVNSYIHLYSNHLLNTQIEQQTVHFLKGFHRLIKKEWMDMFNERELQVLISGSHLDNGLDIDDLCNNTEYFGYTSADPPITMFWEVLRGLNPIDQIKFLKFVTGLSRVPFDGFKKLQPKFNIGRDVENIENLPRSSTCVNGLHLPPYESETKLRHKLLEAINSDPSFGLA